jgi:UDP-N-acetylmuramyl pentapeptide synthase
MKNILKNYISKVLWWQVGRLRSRHNPQVIAVAGSVGKTSTKAAIAHVLSKQYRVAWQKGNYNDIISIPLVFFMAPMPRLFNPFAWVSLFIKNELTIHSDYQYTTVLLELGTDHSGDMARLKGLLKVDYTVLTAITPEHMEGFADLDDVAKDELIATEIAKNVIVDIDSVDKKYVKQIDTPDTISNNRADCVITAGDLRSDGRYVSFNFDGKKIDVHTPLIGRHSLSALAFALVSGARLGIKPEEIKRALEEIKPFPGRMNVFKGKNEAVLIDDTYNASPHAVKAALDALYEITSKHKIAILGQMNELGKYSQEMHEEVGNYCSAKEINLLVTVGDMANKYIAAAAERRGVKVIRTLTPYHAGELVKPLLKADTVVLIKGSQGGIFLEETTKILLNDPADQSQLVRQTAQWQKLKRAAFKDIS